jgi:magnesium and cobalt transporter
MSDDRPSSSIPGKKTWLEKVADAFTGEPKDREDLKEILNEAHENDILDQEAFSIIEGALDVSEMHVRDIMIPRSHMVSVSLDQPLEDILTTIVESGHSRFPVVGDNSDAIQGILMAKDLLALGLQTGFDLKKMHDGAKTLLRQPTFVPESKRLNTLLNDFRSNRYHMAIVADEYGGIAGLVTIEDVLEEIVGEIDDEHDDEEQSNIRDLEQGRFAVDALTSIDEFNDYFQTDINDDEYDTIGGIVTHSFGRLPKRDETIELEGLSFRVLNADDRRLKLLEVQNTNLNLQSQSAS